MWIRVRSMDGKRSGQIEGISKLTKIEDLRTKIFELFKVEESCQRLFYNGKQMEDGYTLYDYDVSLNSLVQFIERQPILQEKDEEKESDSQAVEENSEELLTASIEAGSSKRESDCDSGIDDDKQKTTKSNIRLLPSIGLYKINELVDAKDADMGAWFEGTVVDVKEKEDKNNSNEDCENIPPNNSNQTQTTSNDAKKELEYHIKFDDYDEIKKLSIDLIRPRARRLLDWDEFDVNDIVMANYNPDKPKERGYWFDCKITQKKIQRKYKNLTVQVLLGPDKILQPCRIVFVEEVFHIENKNEKESESLESQSEPVKRNTLTDPECGHCNDNPRRKCKECGCHVCGEKKAFDKTLLCDECNLPFHTFCLDPPLESLPSDDDWYCPLCRNDRSEIVVAGEKLKTNKRKSKMASATGSTQRDWGKGMACVGRTTICTIVPSDHVGPIPGVPVGTLWKFRVQVSEAGVHRPHVSGIHGSATKGAFSIVLAGGYEDDEDNGDEFMYTGSGGRDLSGNKRTAEQSMDQVLTKNNMAIARTCDAKLDAKQGNVAGNWKKSRGIRVVRNYKGAKHSKYAPEEGNRYDGIYKVVKYWPEKGKSGFIVWRYLFRRDDPEPAPWTKAGKKIIKDLGLTVQYPDGYLESQEKKNAAQEDGKLSKKRERDSDSAEIKSPKKMKVSAYKIPKEVKSLIKCDDLNSKCWDELTVVAKEGQSAFYKKLEETFACVCCQELVFEPITTECRHNICKSCLKRSFQAEVYSCAMCRNDLGKNYKMQVNENLAQILIKFFPGYTNGR